MRAARSISAGRNILQENLSSVTSIGPVLPGDARPGAGIVLQAGMGGGGDFQGMLARYLDPENLAVAGTPLADQPDKVAKTYDAELAEWLGERYGFSGTPEAAREFLAALPGEQQRVFARQVFFAELREGGREFNDVDGPRSGSYLRGRNDLWPDVTSQSISVEKRLVTLKKLKRGKASGNDT